MKCRKWFLISHLSIRSVEDRLNILTDAPSAQLVEHKVAGELAHSRITRGAPDLDQSLRWEVNLSWEPEDAQGSVAPHLHQVEATEQFHLNKNNNDTILIRCSQSRLIFRLVRMPTKYTQGRHIDLWQSTGRRWPTFILVFFLKKYLFQ